MSCCCCTLFGYVLLAVVALLAGIKIFVKFTTGMYKGDKKLTGKTVIVTGANTGIGKETARDLAKRGARVILACRDEARANQAKEELIQSTGNKNIVVKLVDFASLSSVRAFAKDIIATEDRLDILINNAGAIGLGDKKTEDGLLVGMQVNHFGPFLLTNLLVDMLKKSSPSRIVFVSSLAHKYAKLKQMEDLNFSRSYHYSDVYNCSKLANVLNANELARQLEGSGVTVNSLHPGLVATDIFRNLPPFLQPICNWLVGQFAKSSVEGAQTTIYLAVADEVEGVTGKYFADCKEAKMAALARDEGLAKKVWEKSEYFVANKSE